MLLHTDMGFSEKQVAEGSTVPWGAVDVGTSLRPVRTKAAKSGGAAEEEGEERSTPTRKEARIPEELPCPPAPKKRKPPPVRCQVSGEYFFCPPDLETVFLRRPERAK